MFFSGFTLTHLTFLYVKHYLSFIYAYCSSLSLSAGHLLGLLLDENVFSSKVCLFKSFHIVDIEIFCRKKDYAGCSMYSSLQQSK